jgi:hypothetical protein
MLVRLHQVIPIAQLLGRFPHEQLSACLKSAVGNAWLPELSSTVLKNGTASQKVNCSWQFSAMHVQNFLRRNTTTQAHLHRNGDSTACCSHL